MSFPHLDAAGRAHMVDVTAKQPTVRTASARGFVRCSPEVIAALRDGTAPKGVVLAVARIAGIQAAKSTPALLPLAHVIGVHRASIELDIIDDGVLIEATVGTADRTGPSFRARPLARKSRGGEIPVAAPPQQSRIGKGDLAHRI